MFQEKGDTIGKIDLLLSNKVSMFVSFATVVLKMWCSWNIVRKVKYVYVHVGF